MSNPYKAGNEVEVIEDITYTNPESQEVTIKAGERLTVIENSVTRLDQILVRHGVVDVTITNLSRIRKIE